MQRIAVTTEADRPQESLATCEEIKKNIGKVINIYATTAHAPAALNGLMGLKKAMKTASLSALEQEAIALRVGELHGCVYCRAAHTTVAKMLGAQVEETKAWRKGQSDDARLQAILRLAEAIVEQRGQLSDEEVDAARAAGLTDAELIETVASVVENTFTNYLNGLFKTDVDFPAAPELD